MRLPGPTDRARGQGHPGLTPGAACRPQVWPRPSPWVASPPQPQPWRGGEDRRKTRERCPAWLGRVQARNQGRAQGAAEQKTALRPSSAGVPGLPRPRRPLLRLLQSRGGLASPSGRRPGPDCPGAVGLLEGGGHWGAELLGLQGLGNCPAPRPRRPGDDGGGGGRGSRPPEGAGSPDLAQAAVSLPAPLGPWRCPTPTSAAPTAAAPASSRPRGHGGPSSLSLTPGTLPGGHWLSAVSDAPGATEIGRAHV